MENARIVIIEDSRSTREAAKLFFELNTNHKVVAEASTLYTALELIDSIADGTIESDVIVLDGNLSPNTESGEDAKQIMERITERGVTSAVIGFSLKPMSDYGIEVTVDTADKSLPSVRDAINEL